MAVATADLIEDSSLAVGAADASTLNVTAIVTVESSAVGLLVGRLEGRFDGLLVGLLVGKG